MIDFVGREQAAIAQGWAQSFAAIAAVSASPFAGNFLIRCKHILSVKKSYILPIYYQGKICKLKSDVHRRQILKSIPGRTERLK